MKISPYGYELRAASCEALHFERQKSPSSPTLPYKNTRFPQCGIIQIKRQLACGEVGASLDNVIEKGRHLPQLRRLFSCPYFRHEMMSTMRVAKAIMRESDSNVVMDITPCHKGVEGQPDQLSFIVYQERMVMCMSCSAPRNVPHIKNRTLPILRPIHHS